MRSFWRLLLGCWIQFYPKKTSIIFRKVSRFIAIPWNLPNSLQSNLWVINLHAVQVKTIFFLHLCSQIFSLSNQIQEISCKLLALPSASDCLNSCLSIFVGFASSSLLCWDLLHFSRSGITLFFFSFFVCNSLCYFYSYI